MTDKERAEMLMAMSQSAFDRFDKSIDLAWKLRLTVWTALAGGTTFVLATDKWRPGWLEFAIGTCVTVFVAAVFTLRWAPFSHARSTRWGREARHWRHEAETVLGQSLPDELQSRRWWPDYEQREWFRSPIEQSALAITLFLATLPVMALWSKAAAPPAPPSARPAPVEVVIPSPIRVR